MSTPTALLVGGAGGTGVLIARGLERAGYRVTILHRGVHEPSEIACYEHIHADPHFAEPMRLALANRTFDLVVLMYGRVRELAEVFAGRCGRLLAVGGIPIYAGFLEPQSVSPAGMPLMASESAPLAPIERMRNPGAARFADKLIEAEQAVLAQHYVGSYSATLLRYPAVYGPLALSGAEAPVIRRIRRGRTQILVPFEGLFTITRCSTFNCAHALLTAVDCEAAAGRVFNCADDDQYTIGQWVEMILDELQSDAEIVGLPTTLTWAAAHLVPLGGTTSPIAMVDARESHRLLGYKDSVPAREALARSVRWHLENASSEPDWGDQMDFHLEDQVIDRLKAFEASLEDIKRFAPAVHPYPHPVKPGLGVDHRGR
ncbi:epimerase [Novosphingobium sp. ERN07]|uniref:epimerase n=1 Tax=Novosphingobium sp. ERN07 TaxID=2726187 RepID=UPI001456EF17|nr:epimerase [Novosphingobium sp. ERN07]NLR73427.1 epimerase [Novosphingobium sp. ERN07]